MFWLRPGASVRRLVFTGKYPEAAAELRIAELNEEKNVPLPAGRRDGHGRT